MRPWRIFIGGGAPIWLLACQLAFDGELGRVRCEAEGAFGPPACPDGLACRDGTCVESAAEGCRTDQDCAGGFCDE
ncbi:MAG: hypothetical protein AAGA56_18135, partial [Myxococcota bacterium]